MNSFFNKSVLLAMGLALCACDADPEDLEYIEDDDAAIEDVDNRGGGGSGGGIKFNTNKRGDKEFSALSGRMQQYGDNHLLSVEIDIKGNKRDCIEVWAEKGELHCLDKDNNVWDNWTFEHSVWTLMLKDEKVKLIIGDMQHDQTEWRYRFNDLASGPDKMPTCDEDADNPGSFWSVVLNDVDFTDEGKMFDKQGLVYLACTSGSIGKTVDMMGVNPWDHDPKEYQAGIYMTMLSPCGDANSLTLPGTPLRVYDTMGVNNFGPGYPYESEGVWDEKGMVCSGKKLRTGWLTDNLKCGGVEIPVCNEAELKSLVLTQPDIPFWTKPKA